MALVVFLGKNDRGLRFFLFLRLYVCMYVLSNFYTQCVAQAYKPEMRSCVPYRLSQPGVPRGIIFKNTSPKSDG